MKPHELKPAPGSRKPKVRVGRGRSGRRGKTAGRGMKGARARGKVPIYYEGGQVPIHQRVPKRGGFRSPNRKEYTVVNLAALDEGFEKGAIIDPDSLRAKGLVRKKGPVKVLGQGELSKDLTVKAHAFSATAAAKIESAGGTVERI